jgi:hypothetical protein
MTILIVIGSLLVSLAIAGAIWGISLALLHLISTMSALITTINILTIPVSYQIAYLVSQNPQIASILIAIGVGQILYGWKPLELVVTSNAALVMVLILLKIRYNNNRMHYKMVKEKWICQKIF